eukprot:CAMPEP_0176030874 /NCGR_PEP_ID=MMETSP0120_2-20121206/15206_1 /TAXON_ID=160619 /ORGANISM="Kryptoperidinium foliaceum, Strain CCMP 1326" /LENGTH=138 /DNA_ID=CAMNT_0017364145 /DNA_START=69 /DNA_END=481 /DNA_ORIENTATION=+
MRVLVLATVLFVGHLGYTTVGNAWLWTDGSGDSGAAQRSTNTNVVPDEEHDLLRGMYKIWNSDGQLSERSIQQERIAEVAAAVTPSFKALPKNAFGRLGTRAMRHLVYKYLVGQRGWHLRGLEPHGMRRASSKALHEV